MWYSGLINEFSKLSYKSRFRFFGVAFLTAIENLFFPGAEIFLFLVESKFQAFTNQFLTIYLVDYDLSIFLK